KRSVPLQVEVAGKVHAVHGAAKLPADPFVIVHLGLNAGDVTLDLLPLIKELSKLEGLFLPPRDADRWVEALPQHAPITMVNGVNCDVTDKGLAQLSRLPKLVYLNLDHCRGVTGAGIRKLADCKSLRILNVDGAMLKEGRYTLADLKQLRQGLPG